MGRGSEGGGRERGEGREEDRGEVGGREGEIEGLKERGGGKRAD